MLCRVFLRGVLGVFYRMQFVTMREVRVVTRHVMITNLGMLGRFAMMLGCLFQMLCSFVVMMMNLVLAHATLLDSHAPGTGSRALLANQKRVSRL
jgi:hypothetical protein